jgi:hypothetical protein
MTVPNYSWDAKATSRRIESIESAFIYSTKLAQGNGFALNYPTGSAEDAAIRAGKDGLSFGQIKSFAIGFWRQTGVVLKQFAKR